MTVLLECGQRSRKRIVHRPSALCHQAGTNSQHWTGTTSHHSVIASRRYFTLVLKKGDPGVQGRMKAMSSRPGPRYLLIAVGAMSVSCCGSFLLSTPRAMTSGPSGALTRRLIVATTARSPLTTRVQAGGESDSQEPPPIFDALMAGDIAGVEEYVRSGGDCNVRDSIGEYANHKYYARGPFSGDCPHHGLETARLKVGYDRASFGQVLSKMGRLFSAHPEGINHQLSSRLPVPAVLAVRCMFGRRNILIYTAWSVFHPLTRP